MRVPAAVAAIPLLAGSAAGVLLVDAFPDHLILAFAAAAMLSLVAACGFLGEDLAWVLLATVVFGFASAGVSMGASSARASYATTLLQWFESHAAAETEPVVVEGILREDVAVTEHGASLTVDVRRISALDTSWTDVRGGLRLVVGGRVSRVDV
ncbi:MAG: hypothetical protein ABIP65_00060, partial [Vicinamibacterales bacterium]